MAKPIIRHARQIIYDDSVAHIAEPLGWGPQDKAQGALDACDARLDALEPLPPTNLSGALDTATMTLVSGFLSGGAPNVFLGGGYPVPGDASSAIFRAVPIHPATPATVEFAKADKGVLHLLVNGVDVDSFDLAAAFNPALNHGNQVYPPASGGAGLLTVTFVGWYNNYALYQRGVAQANLAAINLQPGTNRIQFRHVVSLGEVHLSDELVVFYDTGATPPVVGALTTAEMLPLAIPTKFLSGVQYYTTNDNYEIHSAISAVFNNTFAANAATVNGAQFGVPNFDIAWNDPSAAGFAVPPLVGDAWTYDNVAGVTTSIAGVYNINAKFVIQAHDPFLSSAPFSMTNAEAYLVHTKVATSTASKKEFWDEVYRLKIADPGALVYPNNYALIADTQATGLPVGGQEWDSTAALTDGNAVVYNSGIGFPAINYTVGYKPTQAVNYSAFAAPQVAYYAIASIGNVGQGRLQLLGLTNYNQIQEGAGAQKWRVQVRFPQVDGGASAWWNLGADFVPPKPTVLGSGVHFAAQDVPASGIFGWNIGILNSSFSGQKFHLKLTALAADAPLITKIEFSNIV